MDNSLLFRWQKAMELLDSFQPDILLTNILIPFYSGIELLQAAKAKTNSIEVVILALLVDDAIKANVLKWVQLPI